MKDNKIMGTWLSCAPTVTWSRILHWQSTITNFRCVYMPVATRGWRTWQWGIKEKTIRGLDTRHALDNQAPRKILVGDWILSSWLRVEGH